MFDLKTSAIYVSRNVIFYEDCFPFIGEDKPHAVTVLPILSSHAIDQPDGVSSELPVDHIMHVPNNVDSDPLTLEQSSNATRRSLRQTYIPSKYKDFHVSHPYSTLASYSASTCLYPFNFVLSYRKLSLSYHNIVLSISQSLEPRSYNEASKDPI